MDSPKSLKTAPVAILMFNRPEVTRRTLEAVSASAPSLVFLIADGPRPAYPSDLELCDEVRKIATEMNWGCEVRTNFAKENLGLRNRVISGLNWVFSQVDAAIIVEDDCLADDSFFRYSTELLDRYRDHDSIGIVSGNNFLGGRQIGDESYFFSSDVRIWGWATWSRVWNAFAKEGIREWSSYEAKSATRLLTSPFRRRALNRMASFAHKLDTWDLAFVLHCLSRGYLNAVPRVNLVSNVGFGAQSTHTKFESFTAEVALGSLSFPLRHPGTIADSPDAGRVEAIATAWRWFTFPLVHPIDFASRFLRYAGGLLKKNR